MPKRRTDSDFERRTPSKRTNTSYGESEIFTPSPLKEVSNNVQEIQDSGYCSMVSWTDDSQIDEDRLQTPVPGAMLQNTQKLETSVLRTPVKRHDNSVDESVHEEENNKEFMEIDEENEDILLQEEADIGIIERITLHNFMCHNKLDIRFDPHVNFVTGRNGSGKSAIVAALTVGLGGKASVTNRGSALKNFIKTGKRSAEVKIVIKNWGPDAYKHDKYGDSIVVERKLTESASQYKLKSKSGQVISDKREELMSIVNWMNIQVDNPLAILNQDTSRNFLHSKNPHDRYKFFHRGTQLAQMKLDYDTAMMHREVAETVIKRKEQVIKKLKDEVCFWEQKYKSLDCLNKLKEKVEHLKHELAWAFVQEKEKGLDPLEKELEKEELRIPKFKQKLSEAKAEVDNCTKEQKSIQDQLNVTSEEVLLLKPQYDEAKETLKVRKKNARNVQNEVMKAESTIRSKTKDRNQINLKVEELKQSSQIDETRVREERERLEQELNGLNIKKQMLEEELEKIAATLTKYQKDEQNRVQEENQVQSKEREMKQHLHTLNSARNNRCKRFGAFVPTLLSQIEEAFKRGEFHRKPKGPIGLHVKLLSSKWGLAVEKCLGGSVFDYICHDEHDEKVLQKMISRICGRSNKMPSIYTKAFKDKRYDVTRQRVIHEKYQCVMDVMNVDDPTVECCLIDWKNIERTLLIDDPKEARRIMDPDVSVPPKNCYQAFSLNGINFYCHPSLREYSYGADIMKYLNDSIEESQAKLENELKSIRRTLDRLKQHKIQIKTAVDEIKIEDRKFVSQHNKICKNIHNLKFEINELKNMEDPAPVDITALEEEIEMLDQQILDEEKQKQEKKCQLEIIQREVEEVEILYRNIEQQMREKAESADPLKDMLSQTQIQIEKAKSNRRHYEQHYNDQIKKISDMKKNIEKYQKEIQSDTEKAEKIYPERINTRKSVQQIDTEIDQINKRIREEKDNRGNPEEITRTYNEKLNAFRKIKKEIHQTNFFLKKIQLSLKDRLKGMRDMRTSLSMRMKWHFITVLKHVCGWDGKLEVSHKEEKLNIIVQPKSSDAAPEDIRSLSGGERSVSMVCFILSLWKTVESPIRCLDEFDVFMDMVNRRYCMELMVRAATREGFRKQFIFLTPHNISQLGISQDRNLIKFQSMPDPERYSMNSSNLEEEEQ